MTHRATKTYGHDVGLSCAFRQHRATSHCAQLHGYALAVRLEFEANELDANGWVIDFGALKPVKGFLERTFDHRTLVARDDPSLDAFLRLHDAGAADVLVVDRIGCEAFASYVLAEVSRWLVEAGHAPRVRLVSAEVREHGANGASAHATGVRPEAGQTGEGA